jgi:hypothetical protein
MSGVRPFRFGDGLFRASSAADWANGARLLEGSGYDTLFLGDHFSPNFLAPVPALLAAASATTQLRVSCTVFANDFRHPAALAKEVATLDMLSGGRVEFGIGAGWNKAEYSSVGLKFESPSVRVKPTDGSGPAAERDWPGPEILQMTITQALVALGFFAYCGTFEAQDGQVIHRREFGVFPSMSGNVETRSVVLDADRLVLGVPGGAQLEWQRVHTEGEPQ